MAAKSTTYAGWVTQHSGQREVWSTIDAVSQGEAESLLETLSVEDIVKEGGEKAIFTTLDEKYLPQPRDLLHQALKNFFYDLSVKQGEGYQQFLARFDAATRKMAEQEVKLPGKALGFMLLKKMRFEAREESMVLTATKGDMDIRAAIRSIFPEGRGPPQHKTKEVFKTEVDEPENETFTGEDYQDVLEELVDDYQAREDFEEEDVLEAFESYQEIRRKVTERKKARGFSVKNEDDGHSAWST